MRILIIDDEPSVADALGIILTDRGHEARSARTGRDGISEVDKADFDLVITDLRLPDMTGLDVLDHLRLKNPSCRCILITAYGSSEVKAEALSRGAVAVLAKPFTPAELINVIAYALNPDARPLI